MPWMRKKRPRQRTNFRYHYDEGRHIRPELEQSRRFVNDEVQAAKIKEPSKLSKAFDQPRVPGKVRKRRKRRSAAYVPSAEHCV